MIGVNRSDESRQHRRHKGGEGVGGETKHTAKYGAAGHQRGDARPPALGGVRSLVGCLVQIACDFRGSTEVRVKVRLADRRFQQISGRVWFSVLGAMVMAAVLGHDFSFRCADALVYPRGAVPNPAC